MLGLNKVLRLLCSTAQGQAAAVLHTLRAQHITAQHVQTSFDNKHVEALRPASVPKYIHTQTHSQPISHPAAATPNTHPSTIHQEDDEGGSSSPSRNPRAKRAVVRFPPSSYDSATPGMLRPDFNASLPVDTQRPGGGRRLPLGDHTYRQQQQQRRKFPGC